MKFKYIGDPALNKELAVAERRGNQRRIDQIQQQLRAEPVAVRAYGYRFPIGVFVDVDENRDVKDPVLLSDGRTKTFGKVVDKLRNNPHFQAEGTETPVINIDDDLIGDSGDSGETDDDDDRGMSKAELKDALDDLDIPYKSKATRAELQALYDGAQ